MIYRWDRKFAAEFTIVVAHCRFSSLFEEIEHDQEGTIPCRYRHRLQYSRATFPDM